MTRCYREAIARGLFWAGGVLGSGSGDLFFFRVSQGFQGQGKVFFFRTGCSFFKDRARSGLFPGQGQGKIVKVFLFRGKAEQGSQDSSFQGKFKAKSGQGLSSRFVESQGLLLTEQGQGFSFFKGQDAKGKSHG